MVGYLPCLYTLLYVKGKIYSDFVGNLILKISKQMEHHHIWQLQCLHTPAGPYEKGLET